LPVPSRVARGVVDSLEAVEIDRDDGSGRARRARNGPTPVDVPFEGPSVGASGQWVAESCPLELVSGSTTGVDHREVNQSDDRLLSRPTRPGPGAERAVRQRERAIQRELPACREAARIRRRSIWTAGLVVCRGSATSREVVTSGGLVAVAAVAKPGSPLGGPDCPNSREKPPAAVPSALSSSSRSSALRGRKRTDEPGIFATTPRLALRRWRLLTSSRSTHGLVA